MSGPRARGRKSEQCLAAIPFALAQPSFPGLTRHAIFFLRRDGPPELAVTRVRHFNCNVEPAGAGGAYLRRSSTRRAHALFTGFTMLPKSCRVRAPLE